MKRSKESHFYPIGNITGWHGGGPGTAFMVPHCEYFTDAEANEMIYREKDDEESEAGWYSRLTAPGYLDCTDWQGPYPSAFRAVRDVCRTFSVDLDGNTLE